MPKTSRATSCNRGFSLIEILIVIALIALISAVAIPSFTAIFRTGTESFVRQMANMMREARDRAFLTDKLIRLRFDFEKQQYWLEEAPGSYLMPKAQESKNLSDREKEELEKKEGNAFRMVKEITKEKREMPKGVKLTEILSPRAKAPLTEGTVDVFFYNNGSADGVTFHFEDEEKNKQSLILHPVTGQSKVKAGFIGGEAER